MIGIEKNEAMMCRWMKVQWYDHEVTKRSLSINCEVLLVLTFLLVVWWHLETITILIYTEKSQCEWVPKSVCVAGKLFVWTEIAWKCIVPIFLKDH